MSFREKLVLLTDLKSGQIAILEKMVEHFVLLHDFYQDLSIIIEGKCEKVVSISFNGTPVVTLSDDPYNMDLICTKKGPVFDMKEKNKRIPLFIDSNNEIGMVTYSDNTASVSSYQNDLSKLWSQMKDFSPPVNYLIPDGMVIFDAEGNTYHTNYIADTVLQQLGLAKMYLFQLLKALGIDSEIAEKILIQPAFLGSNVQIKQFDVAIVLYPIFINKKFLGAVLVISDLTQIKKKEKELMEKSTVIKEIHHRVKNNLQTITSILRLQMRRTNLKLVEKVFAESINRILSIALIHEALSKQDLEIINIKQTSFNILQMILSNLVDPNKNISGEVYGDDIYLPATTASSISLCITELIQNAVEHAFENRTDGNILIAVEQTEGYITITVKDNGVGVSASKIMNESSLGLQLVNTIIERKLKGEFSLEGQKYGTIASIKFSKSNIEVIEA